MRRLKYALPLVIGIMFFTTACDQKHQSQRHDTSQKTPARLSETIKPTTHPDTSDESNRSDISTISPTPHPNDPSRQPVAKTPPPIASQPEICDRSYRLYTVTSDPVTLCATSKGVFVQGSDTAMLIVTLIDRRNDITGGMVPHLYRYQHEHNQTARVIVFELNATTEENLTTKLNVALHPPSKLFIKNHILPYVQDRKVLIPLTLLFHGGKNVALYEGLTPIEMIQSDIKRFIQQEE